MVNSTSIKSGSSSIQYRTAMDEMKSRKSLRRNNVNKSFKKIDSHSQSSKQNTPKSIKNINTVTEELCVEENKNNISNDILQLRELKLNIKRIDGTNYISTLSPHTLKIEEKSHDNKSLKTSYAPNTLDKNSRKSLRWNERNENNVMNLVEELLDDDENEINTTKKKKTRRISVSSSLSSDSDDMINTLVSVLPKRTRKSVHSMDLNKIEIKNSRSENKRTRKSVNRLGKSTNLNEIEISNFSPEKKRTRTPVNRYGESVNFNNIEISDISPEKKHKRKTSVSLSTPSKLNNMNNVLECVTPKRTRTSINRYGEPVNFNNIEISDISPKKKHKRKTSVSLSTPSELNNMNNVLECVTPKRTRTPINRYGEPVNFNNIEVSDISPKKKHKDPDVESDIWTTPVNKNVKQSMTPSITRSGSRVRRSILQDIPENKEIKMVSTPKTPRKTPSAHVKNLTASASKRLDNGARIPCSPLEKARASLHLHAAPKHLPCREVEFKSIHSFLSRKINDGLTGSMYISGVPGTGKTATVKRVIDSLNTDLIMKHSFKFIEINGLRLANPHQAFAVIWKELMGQIVSSSRAQALLNDYFSDEVVKELSTVLLVDEVDHICNRKQDVVYNILDWPTRIGSKVIVITIANTMDLPERVLRGCVTSRMGLTRLVFKPYTFQQLQQIIMNRLIGNSSFDPDAVQLVARKVAAVSGDARRALDICRRAIDLIKSEDDLQLITIGHVNQVLNSILSGARVTAIRNSTLFEQFFLKALKNETTRTGFDHSTIDSVYNQMKSICLLEGEELPNDQQVIMMAYRLRDSGLIFLEKKRWDTFRKVSLNVSPEDISYALDKYND